ncbi:hypothetical protein DL240_00025 [Lujinxingia litoralis]|uniref:Thioredoxin domain-containing protein n=1 Tax=Lujinxingia litoralis TaxID=2211119 RepID=A0A328C888_9DELT|nr:redoxin domain-containing protein [Lujinxingia litoralis]RAL24635.1 hypothetical protein DL240_00025 [Lujinxingia litoralis]
MPQSPCTHGIRPPEFPELPWLNTEAPLPLRELLGKVVLVGFISSSCIRCQEGVPLMRRTVERFSDDELQVIAVHSPRFDGERDLDYLRLAIRRVGVLAPVIVDNDHRVAGQFNVRRLPSLALIDTRGYVCRFFCEVPEPQKLFDAIVALLGERDELAPREEAPPADTPAPRSLSFPGGVTADDRRLIIADTGHHRVVIADVDGQVQRVVGGPHLGLEDGDADQARFYAPHGLTLRDDHLVVADTLNQALRRVDLLTGRTSTFCRVPSPSESASPAPWSVSAGGSRWYVACAATHRLMRMDFDGSHIERYAGTGDEDRIDGHRSRARFAQPTDLVLEDNQLYVIDSSSSALRRIDLRTNRVQTLLGQSVFSYGFEDGPGSQALLQHPRGLAIYQGTVYIADSLNRAVRYFEPAHGELSTLENPELKFPAAICATAEGLVVCDAHDHALWRLDPQGPTWTRLELTWPDAD